MFQILVKGFGIACIPKPICFTFCEMVQKIGVQKLFAPISKFLLRQEPEECTSCYGRANNASNVWTHGMHEEEVLAVVFQSEVV